MEGIWPSQVHSIEYPPPQSQKCVGFCAPVGFGHVCIGISGLVVFRLAYRRANDAGRTFVFSGRNAGGLSGMAVCHTDYAKCPQRPLGPKILGTGGFIDILERITDRLIVCAAISPILRRSAFSSLYHRLDIPVCLYRCGCILFVCGARHALVFAGWRRRTFLCRNCICQMVTLRSEPAFDKAAPCYFSKDNPS